MRQAVLILITCVSFVLAGCGFSLPHQTKLSEAMPEIVVTGSYHHPFYKMVVQKLRLSGVNVISQNSPTVPKDADLPSLMIPSPSVSNRVASVDSRAQTLERAIIVRAAATLLIPNHRPIVMRNSLTRQVLDKSGQNLASHNEINIVINETYDELSSQLVMRLSYLGRQSDPDARVPQPGELVLVPSEGDDPESIEIQTSGYVGMTLIEALKAQDTAEKATSSEVSLDNLNNGQDVLNHRPQLPKVAPKLLHEAPEDLNI